MRSVVEIGANVPAFLAKLWKLVDDPESDHLISWSPGGKMFSIQNQADFARELLPLYYKHNNMASFIRQLNMYGFHKVTSVDNGGLKSEKDEIEFCHPCFLHGHPYLLEHIKRKIANPKQNISNFGEEKPPLKPEIMNKVLVDVKQMKGKQESLDARFSVMKHENEALWREIALLRQKHIKQQQIVNNLIQFLMSLVQPSRNGPLKSGMKRRYQLMINNAAHNAKDRGRESKSPRLEPDPDYELDENDVDFESVNGPTIQEVDHEHSEAYKRSRLSAENPEACPSHSPVTIHSYTSPSPANMHTYASPSPAYSISSMGNENVAANEEVDDPEMQDVLLSDDLPIEFDSRMLTGEMPMNIECDVDVSADTLLEGTTKVTKENGRRVSKKSMEHVASLPGCTITSSTQPPSTLPTNIFDSDETNSQDEAVVTLSEVNQQAALSALQNASDVLGSEDNATNSNIDYLSTLASGSYNPNVNLMTSQSKGKKTTSEKAREESLIRNIKEEILHPDEEDWNNMSLATVSNNEPTRPALNRFQSVEEVDDHLETMQTDLESLKELLRSDSYSFDANTLLGLFTQDEPFYNLPPMNPTELVPEKSKENVDDSASQLMSYVPPSNLFDFGDISLDSESGGGEWSQGSDRPAPALTPPESASLNTPQVQLTAPDFNRSSSKPIHK